LELSFEIPIPHLHEFLPLSDFGFGLAHLMLDKEYKHAGTYHTIMQGCLLDNSMYELQDEPLTNEQLIAAAEVCSPVAVIAPDWMDKKGPSTDAAYTLIEAVHHHNMKAVEFLGDREVPMILWTVGGVVQGKDLQERVQCFHDLQRLGCKPICFPFRTPRHETIGQLLLLQAFREEEWYHLLGLQDLTELTWKLPGRWSVDTAKPFKGKRLDKEKSIRGLGRLRIHEELSEEARRIAAWNIAYLTRLAR